MILPDSNVWVYAIDGRAEEHEYAREWLERSDEEIFLVPSLVQLEVLHHVSRNVPAPHQRDPLVDALFSFPATTEPLTTATVRKARGELDDHLETGIGGRDAAVLAHALAEDATLVSHDHSLLEAGIRAGLDVHDPVARPEEAR